MIINIAVVIGFVIISTIITIIVVVIIVIVIESMWTRRFLLQIQRIIVARKNNNPLGIPE